MRIVIALGGNALLRRGEDMTAENQRKNIQIAVSALAPIAEQNELVISHGNGPQVGFPVLFFLLVINNENKMSFRKSFRTKGYSSDPSRR